MTDRLLIAAMLTQGMLAYDRPSDGFPDDALQMADRLIALDRKSAPAVKEGKRRALKREDLALMEITQVFAGPWADDVVDRFLSLIAAKGAFIEVPQ